jgi:dihydroorotase
VEFDLVLRHGRLLDPDSGYDAVADIAFTDGKMAAIGDNARSGRGRIERDVAGSIVMPGMIDFHAHVYSELLSSEYVKCLIFRRHACFF